MIKRLIHWWKTLTCRDGMHEWTQIRDENGIVKAQCSNCGIYCHYSKEAFPPKPVNNAVTRAGGGWGPFVKAMDSVDVRAKELLERTEVKLSKKPVDADQFRASIAAIHALSTMERPDTLGYRAAMLSIRDECEHLIPELEKIRGLHQG